MKQLPVLIFCCLVCSCSTLFPSGPRSGPSGAVVSVVSGSVSLTVEVSAVADGKQYVVSFRDEKRLSAGERYRLDLKPGERAVLSFDSPEAVRTILEIRKGGQVNRFALDHDDLIGKVITISDE